MTILRSQKSTFYALSPYLFCIYVSDQISNCIDLDVLIFSRLAKMKSKGDWLLDLVTSFRFSQTLIADFPQMFLVYKICGFMAPKKAGTGKIYWSWGGQNVNLAWNFYEQNEILLTCTTDYALSSTSMLQVSILFMKGVIVVVNVRPKCTHFNCYKKENCTNTDLWTLQHTEHIS